MIIWCLKFTTIGHIFKIIIISLSDSHSSNSVRSLMNYRYLIFWSSDYKIFWLQWIPSEVCNWGPRDAILRHKQTGECGDDENKRDEDGEDEDGHWQGWPLTICWSSGGWGLEELCRVSETNIRGKGSKVCPIKTEEEKIRRIMSKASNSPLCRFNVEEERRWRQKVHHCQKKLFWSLSLSPVSSHHLCPHPCPCHNPHSHSTQIQI